MKRTCKINNGGVVIIDEKRKHENCGQKPHEGIRQSNNQREKRSIVDESQAEGIEDLEEELTKLKDHGEGSRQQKQGEDKNELFMLHRDGESRKWKKKKLSMKKTVTRRHTKSG